MSRTELQVTKHNQTSDGVDDIQKQRVVKTSSSDTDSILTAQNIVYTIYGVLAGLLTIRFLLSLLAANRAAPFADFIYGITSIFVAPFQNLFGVNTVIDGTRSIFEIETVVAILVYGLLAWTIMRIVGISHPNVQEEV